MEKLIQAVKDSAIGIVQGLFRAHIDYLPDGRNEKASSEVSHLIYLAQNDILLDIIDGDECILASTGDGIVSFELNSNILRSFNDRRLCVILDLNFDMGTSMIGHFTAFTDTLEDSVQK